MSHHSLQKLVVRMLFDDAFASEVYSDTERALSGEELTGVERAQLLAVDRRAWRYDALRRKRTLRTLAEEYKVSTTIILSETRSLASLDRFFSSAFFHAAVRERGSLGMAFAEFLQDGFRRGEWKAPQIADLVRLESAIADCRRTLAREGAYLPGEISATISDRTRIRLAPGFGIGSFEANIIKTIQHVEQYLFELSLMPAMALCDDAPRLTGLPDVEGRKKTRLMFSPGVIGISLSHIDKSTFLVLYETKRTSEIRGVLKRAADAGVKEVTAHEILAHSLETGALMISQ
ncbi:MAG: hypothetical protein IPM55_09505 [Acidobacteria bacterium]|nr:hypothetical protein [Acidobacteriota bacterium]